MKQAIELAKKGSGWVNPNPQVGCVIVSDGKVIGAGYHERFGEAHAERNALRDAALRGNSVEGSTIYVTLEPCSHYGKTPPCADALVDAKPARVVIGSTDPNEQVSGRGVEKLKTAGIQVEVGCMEEACRDLNRPFFHFIQTRLPYIVAKYAMTLDGKIATYTGLSKWITGESAREYVHHMRSRYAAIMVGVGTVLADDPMLTARIDQENCVHQPLRVVCDSALRMPQESQLVLSARDSDLLIATCIDDPCRIKPYLDAGAEVLVLPSCSDIEPPRIDLHALMRELGSRGIDSVMVEGGPTLLGSLFDLRLVDEVDAFIAPKIFGGKEASSPIAGCGVDAPSGAYALQDEEVLKLGDDILIRGFIDRVNKV